MAGPASRSTGQPQPQRRRSSFRATNDWAYRNGYATGFPNFHHADYGRGRVYGTILFRHGQVQWRDVFASVMRIFSTFTFDAAITVQQRRRLLERHSFALTRSATCGNISASERKNLHQAYSRVIRHGVNNDPNANASAIVGGSNLWVNFGNLFPSGDNEIAQTLVHEMMHCAGFSHPTRRDFPDPKADVPGDNGPYYGTPPLRAEFCIAGAQSDVLTAQSAMLPARPRSCVEVDGRFVVASEISPALAHFSETPQDTDPVDLDDGGLGESTDIAGVRGGSDGLHMSGGDSQQPAL